MFEENKALVKKFFEAFDKNRFAADELCTPDFKAHVPGSPPMDAAAFERFVKMFSSGFSDLNRTYHDMIAENGSVAFRFTLSGTHSGDFMGKPASGKEVSFESIGIAHVKDGKIAEWWNSPDRLSVFQQVGAVPSDIGMVATR